MHSRQSRQPTSFRAVLTVAVLAIQLKRRRLAAGVAVAHLQCTGQVQWLTRLGALWQLDWQLDVHGVWLRELLGTRCGVQPADGRCTRRTAAPCQQPEQQHARPMCRSCRGKGEVSKMIVMLDIELSTASPAHRCFPLPGRHPWRSDRLRALWRWAEQLMVLAHAVQAPPPARGNGLMGV